MAAKKYYAVKKGKKTGVFSTWEECREAVEGYAGVQYKGFSTREEAEAYLEGGTVRKNDPSIPPETEKPELPPEGTLLAYVDGSYNDSLKKYAFGCVFLLPDGKIYTEYGNGDNPESLQHRNVTGEMLGAMYAVKTAMLNGFTAVEIRYDYQGIEKWVTGEWRSKTELTGKYAQAMQEWRKGIGITFVKVTAHTNVRFNELADKLAKTGLTEGNGVPKVKRIEDMTVYETDTAE